RDFTINGLFLDPFKRRVIDYVGGLKDLEDGVLKTIGSPPVRMAEDPVRILRAIKFATRIGFRIEDETWDAMCNQAEELSRSAPPRVMEEILRMLRSGTALGAIRMMRASGALRVLLPTIDDFLGRRDDPDPAAHDRADSYWRLLEALDADIHSGRDPSGAVCVAVAFLRIVEREADPKTRTLPGPPEDLFTVAGEVLAPVAEQNRMSRKDLIRARRIIANQPRFTQTGARRFKPVLFMRGEDFKESLFLFRLRSAAWGQGWDIYEGWVERYEQALKVGIDDLTEEESSSRRRRRRPRRRRTSRTSREGSAPDSEAG
ncbi:MAG: poly(A) polymerase, partial [Planctomycetota bacterium]